MLRRLCLLLLLAQSAWTGPALAQPAPDRVTFGLDWKAEAEYGGYYQAIARGIYARHGLKVTIRQGGPQVNQAQLLLAGRLDFNLASNAYLVLNMAQERLPVVAVAAFFQRDPSILLAHPGQGNDSFEALRGKPVMIGADTRLGWWNFLRARFGYTDAQIRPYTFNLAPFLADKRAVQQGYLGSEPYAIRTEAGFEPVVLLLADAGFDGYGSLLTVSTKLAGEKPDLVQRFVAASIEGWRDYLEGDPAPAHALIKRENPEMTDGLLAYGHDVLRARGIIGGDGKAAPAGIGAMTDARWQSFTASLVQQGLLPAGTDYSAAYTLKFLPK